MANTKTVIIKIKRQDNPNAKSHWEEFELTWHPGMNVISSMMEIARNPVTRDGKPTTPITYDSNCLEEVCGSCAMLINGRARMACSALIDKLEQPIRLEPFTKFPVIRDLVTDVSFNYEKAREIPSFAPLKDLQPGEYRMAQEDVERSQEFRKCIECFMCQNVCHVIRDH